MTEDSGPKSEMNLGIEKFWDWGIEVNGDP
jgi:hypothetical protein